MISDTEVPCILCAFNWEAFLLVLTFEYYQEGLYLKNKKVYSFVMIFLYNRVIKWIINFWNKCRTNASHTWWCFASKGNTDVALWRSNNTFVATVVYWYSSRTFTRTWSRDQVVFGIIIEFTTYGNLDDTLKVNSKWTKSPVINVFNFWREQTTGHANWNCRKVHYIVGNPFI